MHRLMVAACVSLMLFGGKAWSFGVSESRGIYIQDEVYKKLVSSDVNREDIVNLLGLPSVVSFGYSAENAPVWYYLFYEIKSLAFFPLEVRHYRMAVFSFDSHDHLQSSRIDVLGSMRKVRMVKKRTPIPEKDTKMIKRILTFLDKKRKEEELP